MCLDDVSKDGGAHGSTAGSCQPTHNRDGPSTKRWWLHEGYEDDDEGQLSESEGDADSDAEMQEFMAANSAAGESADKTGLGANNMSDDDNLDNIAKDVESSV